MQKYTEESKYKPTIGLEIHAELNTLTKMFCSCKNDPNEERVNVNICPICMAHPGSLPVINKEAVKSVLKTGLALGAELANTTEFDRKNYFYPDIPKGYQISQYKHPLVSGGELNGFKITRIHLEEDTATSNHITDYSLVNFNRAGVPLMELVTEPVLHSSSEAVKFGKELQLLLQYLGVAEANMEKGEIRFEANISISDNDVLGTKVEVKNLNSFKALERAIEYEIKRQARLLDKGEKVSQETRGWNEAKQETFSQRSKETAHDYRYFPDPDLPKLIIGEIVDFSIENLRTEIPEIPAIKRDRFRREYGIKDADIEFYLNNKSFSDFFEKTASILNKDFSLLSNYIVSDLAGSQSLGVSHEDMAELIGMISENKVSSRGAKEVIIKLLAGETGSLKVAERYDLLQKSNIAELESLVRTVLEENQKIADEYKAGKESALQFLIGQSMKASKGSANPGLLKDILLKLLKA